MLTSPQEICHPISAGDTYSNGMQNDLQRHLSASPCVLYGPQLASNLLSLFTLLPSAILSLAPVTPLLASPFPSHITEQHIGQLLGRILPALHAPQTAYALLLRYSASNPGMSASTIGPPDAIERAVQHVEGLTIGS